MSRTQLISLSASIIFAVFVIGGAAIYMKQQQQSPAVPPKILAQRTVTKAELDEADGKDGRNCLVAVDGTVYKIEDFTLWQDGEHKSSKGMAYCGMDLTKVISKSPHGRQKLEVLIKVGPLEVQ